MKKFRKGFTLAEVLVALTVIGVISAMTLPTTLSNYQSKTVGVKLSKFVNQVESVSLPYIADNDILSSNVIISDFINKSFIFKDVLKANGESSENLTYTVTTNVADAPTAVLKDGTYFKVLLGGDLNYTKHSAKIDTEKVGTPRFEIVFNPAVKGLSSALQQDFNFVVTEMGYVYPKDSDDCLWAIYDNNYVTTASLINTVCKSNSTNTENPFDNVNTDYGKTDNAKEQIQEAIENNLNKNNFEFSK